MCKKLYTVPRAHPIRIQGKKIPAGATTPDVMQVNANQTAKNIRTFFGINLRASLINDLIVFTCDSKKIVASLSNTRVFFSNLVS